MSRRTVRPDRCAADERGLRLQPYSHRNATTAMMLAARAPHGDAHVTPRERRPEPRFQDAGHVCEGEDIADVTQGTGHHFERRTRSGQHHHHQEQAKPGPEHATRRGNATQQDAKRGEHDTGEQPGAEHPGDRLRRADVVSELGRGDQYRAIIRTQDSRRTEHHPYPPVASSTARISSALSIRGLRPCPRPLRSSPRIAASPA
jgi:hypothetical protein